MSQIPQMSPAYLVRAAIVGYLGKYQLQHPIGHAAVAVLYHKPDDSYNALQPDISFDCDLSTPPVAIGAAPRLPDLVVELVAPADTLKAMRAKAAYYLANGTRLVWLVHVGKRVINALTRDDEVIFTLNDVLDGGEVLPGFTLPVRDIFPE